MKPRVILYCLAACALITGCKEKKEPTEVIALKYEAPKLKAPIRMETKTKQTPVKWLGRDYTVDVNRIADDSLAMVKDEYGQKYVDNRVTISVKRSDGTEFFKKQFTKTSFGSYLDDDYRRTGILEAVTFLEVKGSELVFAASVSHPETDEFIPLRLVVTSLGDISIMRDASVD